VLEQLGLEARKLSIHPDDLRRAPTPFLTIDRDDQLVLVASGPDQQLAVINPRTGLSAFDPAGFADEAFDCLHVYRGRHTPEQKFSIRWLLPYVGRYRLGLVEVFVASLFTQLLSLASPLLFQQIIDRVIGQGAKDSLTGLALLMVIFALLEVVFGSLRTFQFADISNRIDIEMGSSIIAHMLRLNARYFERRPVGELASRLNELDNIRRFLTGTALTVTLDALFASLYLVVMFIYSPLLSMITVATLPLLLIATVGVSPITQRLLRQRSEAYAKTQSLMVEILNGIQTIKLQNSESVTRKKWEEKHLATINRGFKTIIANTTSGNALQLINKLSSVGIIVAGAALVLRNEMTLGELIAFRIISGYVTQPILRVASAWQGFQEMTLSFERLADVINQPLESEAQERNQFVMPSLEGSVIFDHVSFAYSQTAPPQLSGVSLAIPAGSFTGIVGQSGCGKSTLLKLLPRLYRPTQGRVLVDEIDIAKVDLYSFRSQLGYVPQECLLFEGTILSNLTFKDSEIELDEVVAAAKLASAHDFIMSLPYGYSTPVGEKGAGLSGGQRQRIALARMLLQKPRMIILDEATSALDADTELQVVNNIRRHAKGKTILMITHRLSALKAADQIVVMHEGALDSVGTHQELMQRAGRYFVLYQQQFGGVPES
jgi:ATP-binding cassette subfamily B protein